MSENEIVHKILGLSLAVHKVLGPGLLESAYKECLAYKIASIGLHVDKEKPMPLVFENIKLECGYRIDLLVEGKCNHNEHKENTKNTEYYLCELCVNHCELCG